MHALGSVASVVAAIREDAAAEVERIEEAAAAEIAAVRGEAAAADVTIRNRGERIAAALRLNEERIAQQEWEGRRALIEQREEWIRRVVAAAPSKWHGDTASLVRDAVAHLPANAGEVRVEGCTASVGSISFDNSIEARARRFEAQWRSALSALYAETA